jgi:hypothetical protein
MNSYIISTSTMINFGQSCFIYTFSYCLQASEFYWSNHVLFHLEIFQDVIKRLFRKHLQVSDKMLIIVLYHQLTVQISPVCSNSLLPSFLFFHLYSDQLKIWRASTLNLVMRITISTCIEVCLKAVAGEDIMKQIRKTLAFGSRVLRFHCA